MKSGQDNVYRSNVELLADDESYIEKRMFGCLGIYHCGRLKFVLADTEQPWNGILVVTDRSFHESLMNEFPALVSHPVLGKWLYLSGESERFEPIARAIVLVAARDDQRIGVLPNPKKRTKKK